MAFRRMFRPRSRGFSKKTKRDLLWVANSIATEAANGATPDGQSLLLPAQWQVASSIAFERATVLAIRGWLSFRQTLAGAGAFPAFYAAILKQDVQTATMDPALLTEYDDHDMLWTWGQTAAVAAGFTPVTDPRGAASYTLPIDIRVKRKVSSNELIAFTTGVAAGTTAPTYECVGILRVLVDRS